MHSFLNKMTIGILVSIICANTVIANRTFRVTIAVPGQYSITVPNKDNPQETVIITPEVLQKQKVAPSSQVKKFAKCLLKTALECRLLIGANILAYGPCKSMLSKLPHNDYFAPYITPVSCLWFTHKLIGNMTQEYF